VEELFAKKNEINRFNNYYRQWIDQAGLVGREKPRSKAGEEYATKIYGPKPPRESAGINQPKPTNPLFNQFMGLVHDKFGRDLPSRGGIGFLSAMDRFAMYNTHLQRMRKVDEGNMVTWQKQIEAEPEQLQFLRDNNINPKDIKAVRNLYERKRQDLARTILHNIKAVEDEISQQAGRKVTLKDISPYGQGLEGDTTDFTNDVQLPN